MRDQALFIVAELFILNEYYPVKCWRNWRLQFCADIPNDTFEQLFHERPKPMQQVPEVGPQPTDIFFGSAKWSQLLLVLVSGVGAKWLQLINN